MDKKGYTLTELLITVTIISIVAVVAMFVYGEAQTRVNGSKTVTAMKTLVEAASLYEKTMSSFATDVGGGATPAFIPQYTAEWPKTGCEPNIVYDWDSWIGWTPPPPEPVTNTWSPVVRISMRRVRLADGSPDDTTIYYACVQSNKNNQCTCNDYTPEFPNQHFCKGYAKIEDAPTDLTCDYMMDTTRFPSYGHF